MRYMLSASDELHVGKEPSASPNSRRLLNCKTIAPIDVK